jgi:hypothetical protein
VNRNRECSACFLLTEVQNAIANMLASNAYDIAAALRGVKQ